MKTDIPLKRLTALRGADLLPLLGLPAAALLRVESRELPASATRLDTVLRVRSPQGQNYLHILEWQGYPDRTVLWRLAGYRAWFGQQEPGTAVVGTVVYLRPEADAGDTIAPTIDGQVVQPWGVGRIALWEQDGQAALASGSLGLVVLSPLMRHADVALVETAASLVLTQAPPTQQGDLLSILGVFAEPLVDAKRFTDLVGRERLMSSDLFDYLMKDREAELRSGYEAKLHQQEAQFREALHQQEAHFREQQEARLREALHQQEAHFREQQEVRLREVLQQTLEDLVLVRFPSAPLTLARDIRQIHDPAALRRLMVAVQQVPDLIAAEALLHEAAQGEGAPAAG